jgi:hypothetical protein
MQPDAYVLHSSGVGGQQGRVRPVSEFRPCLHRRTCGGPSVPVLVLLQQDRPHQAGDGFVVGVAISQRYGKILRSANILAGVLPGVHRAQGCRDHHLVGLWDMLYQIASEVEAAALAFTTKQLTADGLGEI